MQVQLYGCYNADKRLSMDVCAKQLLDGLNVAEHKAALFTPQHSVERWPDSRFLMRYLRYWAYPRAVRAHGQSLTSAHIHHVVDHGYAHLHPHLGAGPKVVTVHDLIPYLTWSGRIPAPGPVRKPHLNMFSLNKLKHFDRIISVSPNTAADLVDVLGIAEDKISVLPNIIADHFRSYADELVTAFRDTWLAGIDPNCKLILLSGREHYKNLRTSLLVVKGLIESGERIKVIRTGLPNHEFQRQVVDVGLQAHTQSIFLPSHAEVALLYNAVDCLLFPSWYEGFGMPVLEALGCGTPVVSSNSSSLTVLGGSLALYASPSDIDGLSAHVLTCLHDVDHQRRVANQSAAWLEPFRSAAVTRQLIDIYNEL